MSATTPFRIQRAREVIELREGFSFDLIEMSCAEVEDYIDMQASLIRQAIQLCLADNEAPTQTALAKRYLRNAYPLAAWCLRHPRAENTQPMPEGGLTADWVKHQLGPQEIDAILTKQDELNSVEAILKNGGRLLLLVEEAVRQEQQMTPTSLGPESSET